jgi:hypothetical protein
LNLSAIGKAIDSGILKGIKKGLQEISRNPLLSYYGGGKRDRTADLLNAIHFNFIHILLIL